MGGIPESAREIVRNRYGLELVRIGLERKRDEDPPERNSNDLSQNDPQRVDSDEVAHSGETQQKLGALTGGIRAEGDDPRWEPLASNVVAVDRLRSLATPGPNDEKNQEVEDENGDDGRHARSRLRVLHHRALDLWCISVVSVVQETSNCGP